MVASPLGRSNAGEVYLIFGDGAVDGTLDTGVAAGSPRLPGLSDVGSRMRIQTDNQAQALATNL